MKRIAATVILTFGLIIGALAGGPGLAGAQAPSSRDCYPGCTQPGHHTGLPHSKPTGRPSTTPNSGGMPAGPTGTPTGTPTGPSASPAAPASSAIATPPATTLAFPGADVAGTILLGVVLIGGGLLLVAVTRRRRVPA
jgi:hypothetical protein